MQAADLRRAAEVGVDAHVGKPFDPDSLTDTVARALAARATKPMPGHSSPQIP
jgi:CheY-like chemotaxis protein